MKIKTIEIAGFASVTQSLRLPFGKDSRSYSNYREHVIEMNNEENDISYHSQDLRYLDERDLMLMSALVKRGDEHAKAIRGIIVYAQIEAPIWFYRELETYRMGRERLASESTMHIKCKGLSGEELEKAKDEIPMGHIQKTIDWFSYQTLRRIWIQRHNHRLPMWHKFCEWIESLPLANELILTGLK